MDALLLMQTQMRFLINIRRFSNRKMLKGKENKEMVVAKVQDLNLMKMILRDLVVIHCPIDSIIQRLMNTSSLLIEISTRNCNNISI
jgi:hypothetical protein